MANKCRQRRVKADESAALGMTQQILQCVMALTDQQMVGREVPKNGDFASVPSAKIEPIVLSDAPMS